MSLKPHLWFTLYALLKLGAGSHPARVSSVELAREIESSQQSASRHTKILEDQGFIRRKVDPDGSLIFLTEKGLAELHVVLVDLQWHLEGKEKQAVELEGVVSSGLYEGAYYISKDGYRLQIIDKLGFDPYPGTLNVTVTGENLEKKRHVERGPGVRIEGFSDGERSFGACTCYPLVLNDEVEGALLVADRSIHEPEVLEIVSPHYIRKRLELSDGDKVRVRFVPLRRSVS